MTYAFQWKRIDFSFDDPARIAQDHLAPVYGQAFNDFTEWKKARRYLKEIGCKLYSGGWHYAHNNGHLHVYLHELRRCGLSARA